MGGTKVVGDQSGGIYGRCETLIVITVIPVSRSVLIQTLHAWHLLLFHSRSGDSRYGYPNDMVF